MNADVDQPVPRMTKYLGEFLSLVKLLGFCAINAINAGVDDKEDKNTLKSFSLVNLLGFLSLLNRCF